MSIKVDVILDLAHGDSGKGKISHKLLSSRRYNFSMRFNGGGNAGHTIYHEGKKYVTHLLPAGVFYEGITSIIGPGCVINPGKFHEEIESLWQEETLAKNCNPLNIWVAHNVHIVGKDHLIKDTENNKVGTTLTGNGPAYAAKYARENKRAEDCKELIGWTVDLWAKFFEPHFDKSGNSARVLAEGAQGFGLDIDWGNYPYVTSSHCGIGGLLNNGFNTKQINNVYGVFKAYDTYVGSFDFEPKDEPLFPEIRRFGQEYGATTGRPRQINWIDLRKIKKGILMNGVTHLIINKLDILNQFEAWNLIDEDGKLLKFPTKKSFMNHIIDFAGQLNISSACVWFSETADGSDLKI